MCRPIGAAPLHFRVALSRTSRRPGHSEPGRKKGADHDVDFWMRETLCLARDNEAGWKIVHEHTSVPFSMDGSNRAAFDLEP